MTMDITLVIKKFIPSFIEFREILEGHIHRTFKVYTNDGNYILQIINSQVFPNVDDVMNNISIVCSTLKSRSVYTLEYLPSIDGKYYYITSQGEYIRICKYVENSISLNFSNDLNTIYNVGLGFGQFCYNLSSIDKSKIIDTIPNFHNTEYYLNRVLDFKDVPSNVDSILNEVFQLKDFSKVTQPMKRQITHNDTKFNNILLDKVTKRPLCVIDLDTIMNGYIAYDFADGVRSICKDSHNHLDISKLKAYYQGFLNYPMDIEIKSLLIDSIVAVSLELSSRYLYEYLTHGNYFNLTNFEDNLYRADLNLNFAKDVLNKKSIITKNI